MLPGPNSCYGMLIFLDSIFMSWQKRRQGVQLKKTVIRGRKNRLVPRALTLCRRQKGSLSGTEFVISDMQHISARVSSTGFRISIFNPLTIYKYIPDAILHQPTIPIILHNL